jgi:S-formylglutathione hydrolase FrmB
MQGRLEWLEFEAIALVGNPLGGPARRPVLVYLPPGYDEARERYPAVYFLHGLTGSARAWVNTTPFAPSVPERLDELVSGGAPPAIGVFPDGWTALGGTQWIDSEGVGRYGEYVARDLVSFVDASLRTIPRSGARALVGKSSGGYGALALASRREVFDHVASHAADAGFEYCYLPDFPKAAAALQDTDPAAWLDGFLERAAHARPRADDHAVLNVLAMAAHYSPKQDEPLGLELPFHPATARLREAVWARWLEHDPVRFVPRRIEAFRRLRSIYVDCGTRDEFNLRWGARMVVEALRAGGVEVVHEEFDDGHRGIDYRYASSLGHLLPRLARE